jgi:Ca2+-binding RTX toxin-like protein
VGTYYYAGHTYQIVKTAMTWAAAKAWAESQGGHLAYVTSATENQALVSMVQLTTGLDLAPSAADGGGARYLWLGGSDADVEGTWRWGDGTLVTSGYSNWGAGALGVEPDNYGGVQDSMAFGLQSWPQPSGGIGTAFKWNDINPTNSLYFVVEWDHIRGTTGADNISQTGNATVYGLEGNDIISLAQGSNYLRGDAGDDSVFGGSGFDDINGNMGADTLRGNDGEDWVVGGKDNDLIFGDAAFDIVYGNMGNDTVDGGAGNDWVRGGQGDDSVTSGAGDDWLWGDRGNDTISGGAGADLFYSFSGAGIDRITDFSYAEGDRLKLEGGPSYSVSQVGADVIVDMGNGDQVILVGVSLASLGSGWIL